MVVLKSSAIGHGREFGIADFAADVPRPSGVPGNAAIEEQIAQHEANAANSPGRWLRPKKSTAIIECLAETTGVNRRRDL
jgi:exonuclease VII large subunit